MTDVDGTVRRCLPRAEWPEPDRAAWAAAHHRGGLLEEDGLAASWAPATSAIIAGGYGRFLSFLAETGELAPHEFPATRISRARVEAYIAELRERNHSSTVAREHDARGEPIYGARKVNDAAAGIVRGIFSEFAAGKSPRRIAHDLNRARITGPRGGEWDASTINGNAARGTGILNNELYIGRLVWNRLRYVKDPTTGKRVSRLNEQDQLDRAGGAGTAHHSAGSLGCGQRAPADRSNGTPGRMLGDRPFWARQRPRYLVSGLAKCGDCGGELRQDQREPVRLCRRHATRAPAATVSISASMTSKTMILDGLRSQLMAPDLFKAFCEEFHREVNRLRIDGNAAVEARAHELDRIERRIRKIVELITDDDAPVRAAEGRSWSTSRPAS